MIDGPAKTDATTTPPTPEPEGMHRRTIMKATTWSMPVIALANTTPLAAATVDGTMTVTGSTWNTATATGTIDVLLTPAPDDTPAFTAIFTDPDASLFSTTPLGGGLYRLTFTRPAGPNPHTFTDVTIQAPGYDDTATQVNYIPPGSLDINFGALPSTGLNNTGQGLAVQSDGKILVTGNFTTVDGVTRSRIARLNTDGTLDTTFDPGLNNTGQGLAVQSDGRILVTGLFTNVNGFTRNRIARLNTDGTLDTTFGALPGTGLDNNTGRALAVQSDGRILVTGTFTSVNGTTRNRIARLNTDGTLDIGFDPDISSASVSPIGSALAIQPGGKILIAGQFTTVGGVTRNRIARLNTDGTLDTTFGAPPSTGLNEACLGLALQSDGKILVTGLFTNVNGVARNRIARLNADGTLDTTFTPGNVLGTSWGNAVAVQPDGKVLITGQFSTTTSTIHNRIVRLNADGTLDTTFNPGTGLSSAGTALALQSDGKIVVTGAFTTVNGVTRNRIARLNG